MNKKLKSEDVTPELKSCVNIYMMLLAKAQTIRKHVDKIQRGILAECPLTCGHREDIGKDTPEKIIDPENVYLCEDKDRLEDYYAECDKRERAEGLKPASMERDYCPALVAEHDVVKSQWLLFDAAARMLGLDFDGKELNNTLLCMGLQKHQEFIDLCCKLIVNAPDYVNPLTGKGA